jgi:glycosyltransferase involved in cell wall biosynthesis
LFPAFKFAVKIFIVLPAFNEAATIAGVVASIHSLGTLIVVDDCSNDDTASLAADEGAVVVRHASNRGYDGALNSGFVKASELGADMIFTFDADGQHGVEALRTAIDLLAHNHDVDMVVGKRPRSARFGEAVYSLYTKWRYGIDDILCGLKGYRISLFHHHGAFDTRAMIGTELTLASIGRGAGWATFDVPIAPRLDKPRLGSALRANRKILRALSLAIWLDISGGWKRTRKKI